MASVEFRQETDNRLDEAVGSRKWSFGFNRKEKKKKKTERPHLVVDISFVIYFSRIPGNKGMHGVTKKQGSVYVFGGGNI